MRLFIVFSLLFAFAGTSAQAAIMLRQYDCGGLHQPGKTFPIPDAPKYDLSCTSRSAISGTGTGCDIDVTTLFPLGKKSTIILTEVKPNVWTGGNLTVTFTDGSLTKAEINAGFGVENCVAHGFRPHVHVNKVPSGALAEDEVDPTAK